MNDFINVDWNYDLLGNRGNENHCFWSVPSKKILVQMWISLKKCEKKQEFCQKIAEKKCEFQWKTAQRKPKNFIKRSQKKKREFQQKIAERKVQIFSKDRANPSPPPPPTHTNFFKG